MRICIIDSYLNIFLFDQNTSLDELNSLIIGLAENKLDTNKFYIFSDYEGPKIRLCHLLLRIIDTMSWIPACDRW